VRSTEPAEQGRIPVGAAAWPARSAWRGRQERGLPREELPAARPRRPRPRQAGRPARVPAPGRCTGAQGQVRREGVPHTAAQPVAPVPSTAARERRQVGRRSWLRPQRRRQRAARTVEPVRPAVPARTVGAARTAAGARTAEAELPAGLRTAEPAQPAEAGRTAEAGRPVGLCIAAPRAEARRTAEQLRVAARRTGAARPVGPARRAAVPAARTAAAVPPVALAARTEPERPAAAPVAAQARTAAVRARTARARPAAVPRTAAVARRLEVPTAVGPAAEPTRVRKPEDPRHNRADRASSPPRRAALPSCRPGTP
jgi:hypothetical protein